MLNADWHVNCSLSCAQIFQCSFDGIKIMKKWIFAAIFLMPLTASADFMRFEFEGLCGFHCRAIGLTRGDPVSGYIETENGLDRNRLLRARELTDFSFDFGRLRIRYDTHRALGRMVLNDDGTGFGGARFIEGFLFRGRGGGAAIGSINLRDFSRSGWIARVKKRVCYNGYCKRVIKHAAGPGGYTKVAEPGTLGLFGLGLLVLGVARRPRAT